MHAAQIETYRNMHKMNLTGRELEAAVLTKAAQKLTFCQDNWEASDREEKLDEALKYNQKVWTFSNRSCRIRTILCRKS